jgi:CheY-like chemotaxis protein
VSGAITAGRRVLIVEDDPESRETLRLNLEASGHRVDEASDGASGLRELLRLRPDVALIDVGLPDLDGHELVRRARAHGGAPRPYLVAVTGYGQPEDVQRARDVGFDALLPKPLDWDRLDRLLAALPPT